MLSMADPKTATPDRQALDDIKAVLREPPYTAGLYIEAAMITLTFNSDHEEGCAQAIRYLEQAIQFGHSPQAIVNDPLLRRSLAGRADFPQLLERKPGPRNATPPNLYLARPPLD